MTMKTHHADNVRIKHRYLGYLEEAKGHAEASLDSVAQALDRFETYTHHRDFKAFHPEQAKAFQGAPDRPGQLSFGRAANSSHPLLHTASSSRFLPLAGRATRLPLDRPLLMTADVSSNSSGETSVRHKSGCSSGCSLDQRLKCSL